MNSTTARTARISAVHGTTRSVISTAMPPATESACLDGEANIAQNVSIVFDLLKGATCIEFEVAHAAFVRRDNRSKMHGLTRARVDT